MIMTLPNIKGQIGNTKAEITDNNELYLNSASYKDIIRILTKLIWGVDHCQYCGMKFVNCNCTSIDHIYPQYLGGGVEVTNFLTVACKRCNGDKGDLTINQYLKVLEMEQQGVCKEEIKQFKANSKIVNEEIFKLTHKYQIPEEYIDYHFSIKDIEVNGKILSSEIYNSKGYRQLKGFYKEYGYFKHPIILDKRGKLADGRRIYEFAKVQGFKIVPVIIIDNLNIWF